MSSRNALNLGSIHHAVAAAEALSMPSEPPPAYTPLPAEPPLALQSLTARSGDVPRTRAASPQAPLSGAGLIASAVGGFLGGFGVAREHAGRADFLVVGSTLGGLAPLGFGIYKGASSLPAGASANRAAAHASLTTLAAVGGGLVGAAVGQASAHAGTPGLLLAGELASGAAGIVGAFYLRSATRHLDASTDTSAV